MQKKLIALAIAGLSTAAFAQSNVTISGQVKVGFENYKLTNAATDVKQNLISDQTSKFVFNGSENLGNGLSAIFQIDTRFSPDTQAQGSGTVGGGNTFVGLKSASLGEFKFGKHDLHYNEIEAIEAGANGLSQQAMVGRGIMNQVGVQGFIGGTADTRTNNVVMWDSPTWSGVNARVAYSTQPAQANEGSTTDSNKGNLWNAVVRYNANNIKAGVSYLDYQDEAATKKPEHKSTRAWGAYTFPIGVQVGLAYDSSKIDTGAGDMKRGAWAIPVSYTTGAHGVYATYAKAKKSSGSLAVANDDAKQWMLGYDYTFSKRTAVGVSYTKLDNNSGGTYDFANLIGDKGVTTGAGNDAKQLYVGMTHKF